jgi:mannose-6-phosphate isomerase-like protein (cupin superfamily)
MRTTGRTLDADGQPVPGTGFTFDPDGDLAALLARRTGPLTSHPERAVWSATLPAPPDEPDTVRSVSVYEPGFDGPPEHYHEQSEERFAMRAGEATFVVDDREIQVGPGDEVIVEPGERHTFRIEGDGRCDMVVDIRSPGKLRHVLPTLSGLAHDEGMAVDDPLQQALVLRRLADNTVFTELPPAITGPLSALLEPVARLTGYQGAYAKYARDAFWERHVEQPAL